jgi:hypothetical protein
MDVMTPQHCIAVPFDCGFILDLPGGTEENEKFQSVAEQVCQLQHCDVHSVTISSLSCMQTLVSSSHSHSKLLKLLKVLKNSTCFGQYGHPQVLKFLVGETAAIVCVPSMRTYVCNMRENIFVRIFVREVSLYRVVTCLCTHCAWCVLPVVFSCLFCFLMLAGLV